MYNTFMDFEKTQIEELKKRIEFEFMPFVRRPSRYIGGEINCVKKDGKIEEIKFELGDFGKLGNFLVEFIDKDKGINEQTNN